MAVTPIGARCTRCGEPFELHELLDDRSGLCPRCNTNLAADWTHKLLEDAGRADVAMRHLVRSLAGLQSLPSRFNVRPSTVLRNLFEETGWTRGLAGDPDLFRAELRELRRLLAAWEVLEPETAEAQPRRSVLRRAADFVVGRKPAVVIELDRCPREPSQAAA